MTYQEREQLAVQADRLVAEANRLERKGKYSKATRNREEARRISKFLFTV